MPRKKKKRRRLKLKSYQDFIGSWMFFSICTTISILSLFKKFDSIQTIGLLDGVLNMYITVASSLQFLGALLPIKVPAINSLIFTSWTMIFAPAFVAIYKHLKTKRGKFYLYIGIAVFLLLQLVLLFHRENGGGFRNSPIGAITTIFFLGCVMVFACTSGMGNRVSALMYFVKNFAGAMIVCWLMILAGLADLLN